jgi:hypothetical protein
MLVPENNAWNRQMEGADIPEGHHYHAEGTRLTSHRHVSVAQNFRSLAQVPLSTGF